MKKTSCKRGFTQDVMLNSFQHLHLNQPSFKAEEALNKGSFRAPLRFGFTLIELLVVVLIIGILAAVAVPQYKVAVEKSRVASDLAILKALANARQVYRLSTGQYNCNLEELDIDFPYVEKKETTDTPYQCDSNIKQIVYKLENGHVIKISVSYDALILASKDYVLNYHTYGKDGHSGTCYGLNDFGERVCKSFGEYSQTLGQNKHYKFG